MKLSLLSSYVVLSVFIAPTIAWAGMDKVQREIEARGPEPDADAEPERLIGDLHDLSKRSDVGDAIARILGGTESAQSDVGGYRPPGPVRSRRCREDECCKWGHFSRFLTRQLRDRRTGQCNDLARACIRLGFHDAGTWSKKLAAEGSDFGGADGSIVKAREERDRPGNNGLQRIIRRMEVWTKIFDLDDNIADAIQFCAIHATVTCPLGPRVRFFAGRKDSRKAAPDGLLPKHTDSAQVLMDNFADKGFTPRELVALVGAHTTSRQRFADPANAGKFQDSTPGVWDTAFYGETLDTSTPRNVFKFQSDINLSQHPTTAPTWKFFVGPAGQGPWNGGFARAYVRMSMVGVKNINSKLFFPVYDLPNLR